MKPKALLILILIFASFLRLYQLGHLELFGDELDAGYHAYSLWQTGKDYLGQRFPVYIHSFSEWRAPLLMYLTAPFVAIFGLNQWGVRLPVVLFGLLNITLVYYLVKSVARSEGLSLLAALILAIIPWHIHYSKVAFEATLLLSLVLLGTVAFINKRWFLASMAFGLSFYAYNTANVFIPIWLLVLFFIFRDKVLKKPKGLAISGIVFFFLLLPILFSIIRGQGSERFKLISVFNNPKTIDQIVFKRNTGINPSLERVFYNKIIGWGNEFFSNYLTAFSPQFLFLSGDPNPRHNPPGFGQLYLVVLPFLLLGIWSLGKDKNKQFRWLIFSWLLLSPIPSSLTVGGGNQATRLFLMLPPLVVLSALGFYKLLEYFPKIKSSLFTLSFLLFAFSLVFWFREYLIHYPKENYQWWHYGYQQLMTWVKFGETDYQRLMINNSHEPALIRYLFWTGKKPNWFQENFVTDQSQKDILPGFNGFKLDKVYFGEISFPDKVEWLKNNLDEKSVYLAFQKDEIPGDWDWGINPPAEFKILKVVYDPWQKPFAYWITKKVKS